LAPSASRGLARRQRDATRTLKLHAWHLRQVTPERTALTPALEAPQHLIRDMLQI